MAVTVGGSVTVGEQLSITVSNASLSGGQEVVSYTTMSGDTASSIATALKSAINADTNLQNINVSATSSSAVVSIAQAATTYTESVSGGATETITLGGNVLGNSSAVIGGTKTTGDTLTITAHNAQLSGGSEAVTYTVLSGDSLPTIAAGVAAAINADTHLQTLGVSASNSNAANVPFSRTFNGNGTLPGGASTANVSAVDGGANTKTNGYALSLNSGSSASLTFDANGNMTQDQAGNSYSWDCENRLIKVSYPGSGNYSAFSYDGFGRNVLIQEYTSSSLTSTRQFVWCDNWRCEARDTSSTVTAQYFLLGQTIHGTSYLYSLDHLGSIREMTDSSGTIEAQYVFDPIGRQIKLQGSLDSDLQYARYYYHAASRLSLTRTRAYSSTVGGFINRDPIQENGGVNLFAYVRNNPMSYADHLGLAMTISPGGYLQDPTQVTCVGYASGMGFEVTPGPGQSFSSFFASLPAHVTCTAIDNDKCPNCKCPPGRYPFLFILFIPSAYSSSPYAGTDPFTNVEFAQGFAGYHAMVPNGNGGWTEISGEQYPETEPTTVNVPNPYNAPNAKRYCCCSDYPPNEGVH